LGLPVFIGRSKTKTFAAVKGRVQKKLVGWKEKFLSQASKEILIKTVVQAPQNALQWTELGDEQILVGETVSGEGNSLEKLGQPEPIEEKRGHGLSGPCYVQLSPAC